MADEVVRLGVDPTGAEEGYRRYDAAAERSIQSTERLSGSISSYERALAERIATEREVMDLAHAEALAMDQVVSTTGRAANASTAATAGLSRLNYSLASVARQAAGVHPIFGQLASTVATFAVGSTTTVGVLAGLAAIAGAIRLIGRDARDAKERLEDARGVLDRLAPDTSVQESLEVVQARLEQNRARFIQLMDPEWRRRQALSVSDPSGMFARFDREAEDLLKQNAQDALRVALGGAELDERSIRDMTERARALQESIGYAMAEVDKRVYAGILEDRRQAELDYQRELQGGFAAGIGGAPPRFSVAGGAFQKEAEEQQLQTWEAINRANREALELERERDRANIALVHSIRAVGAAYGGAAEQLLSLISAAIALERMPGFAGKGIVTSGDAGDLARGYGAAALGGVGYGVTTGDPALGFLGGAASGFAVAGPGGAIVGAVSGLVSGLFEEGRRAEEAARIWRRSLTDFRLMFDDLTPIESNLAALDRAFEQLSGGRTVSEVEKALADLRRWQTQIADPTGALAEQIRRYEELLKVYADNADQARELADAERDLYDARIHALNAPEGLRLSLLEWRAAGTFGPDDPGAPLPPGGGGSGPAGWPGGHPQSDPFVDSSRARGGGPVYNINVYPSGLQDPHVIADAIFAAAEREALRGGYGSPLAVSGR